jgi:geranylgeranylglycerol-phosphate geranylgeranyltransferase
MPYLRLIRPFNCAMAAAAVLVAAVVAAGLSGLGRFSVEVVLAAAAVFFVTAAGNTINDYVDREGDAVNHPDRPIPAGEISPRDALTYALILFLIPVPLSAFVNLEVFLVVILNSVLLVVYEKEYKGRGLPGNLLISYLVGSIFLFGGFAVWNREFEPMARVAVLGALAFVTTLAREITKDIEDVAGDADRVTLPMRIGIRGAHGTAAALLFLGVGLSALPLILSILDPLYLVLVVPADIMFIYASLIVAEKPGDARALEKLAMLVALFAFLVGGVL